LEGCTAGRWIWWNTASGALETDEQIRRWWDQIGLPRGERPNWISITPLDVKVRGNVGLLFAYVQDSWTDDFGGIQSNEYKALVVFHKEEGSYKLIGGMYVPVSSTAWGTP
jgi:ketosteroid isomerase-like protein